MLRRQRIQTCEINHSARGCRGSIFGVVFLSEHKEYNDTHAYIRSLFLVAVLITDESTSLDNY